MKDLEKLKEQTLKKFHKENPNCRIDETLGWSQGWDAAVKTMEENKKPFKDIDTALDEKLNM